MDYRGFLSTVNLNNDIVQYSIGSLGTSKRLMILVISLFEGIILHVNGEILKVRYSRGKIFPSEFS